MNLVTITVDLDTHVVVPKEPTEEWHLKLAKDRCEWDTGLDVIADVIAAAPPYQSEQVNNMVWIPVSERLPEEHKKVIVFVNRLGYYPDYLDTSFRQDGGWKENSGMRKKITHWMHMPAAPKGEE